MRNIVFIERSSYGFSIEKIFEILKEEFMLSEYVVSSIKTPKKRDNPLSIFFNICFVIIKSLKYNNRSIFHITGVLHYLFFALPRKRTILTIHDCGKYHNSGGLKKIYAYLFWFKLPVKYFKYIVVISETTKADLVKITKCDPNKIRIIENPISPAILKDPKNFNFKNPIILHIGTKKNKNLLRLIQAIENIKCSLIIVGEIDGMIIRELKSRKISFKNYCNISDKEMIELYKKCDILSFVTTFEGFGVPILEAQSVGRVVLTSRIEPHYTVASKDGAVFVNPYDVNSIKEGVKSILNNNLDIQNIISNGFKNSDRFSSKIISSKYLSLYQDILDTL